MKISIINKIGVVLLSSVMISGCTDGFEELNQNPNKTDRVNAEYMFNSGVYQTLKCFDGEMKRVFANYAEYFSGYTNDHFMCFAENTSKNDNFWTNIYTRSLLPFQFIDEQLTGNEEYHNRVLMADTWKAYLFSQLTAIYGPVPYTEALSGNPHIKYDDEKTIYYGLLDDLKRCADGITLDGDKFQQDAVYPTANGTSDLLKWKKFANSLRLRLAVRIANADPEKARAVIAEIMANESLLMTSNDDNCTISWGTTADTRNYFYDQYVIDEVKNASKLTSASEAALMYTVPYKDPRVKAWFTEAPTKTIPKNFHWAPYWGQPKIDTKISGSDVTDNVYSKKNPADFSMLQGKFLVQDYTENIMTYAEVALLKSEIRHKGYGSGSKSAKEYYEDGVKASMAQWGVSTADAAAYLTVPGIQWNTLTDLNATAEGERYYQDWLHIASSAITSEDPDPIFKQIVMQQWLCQFFRSVDGWTLRRRTQVLDFVPHLKPTTKYGAVNVGTSKIPFAYVPNRMVFPSCERVNNLEELTKGIELLDGGENTLDTKLWFALPTLHNKYMDKVMANQ